MAKSALNVQADNLRRASASYTELYNDNGLQVWATKSGKFEVKCGSTRKVAHSLQEVEAAVDALGLHQFPSSGAEVRAAIHEQLGHHFRLEIRAAKGDKEQVVHTITGTKEKVAEGLVGVASVDVEKMAAGVRYAMPQNMYGGEYMILVPMNSDVCELSPSFAEPQMYEKQEFARGQVLHGICPLTNDVVSIVVTEAYPNGTLKDQDGRVYTADEVERLQFSIDAQSVETEPDFHEPDDLLYQPTDIPTYNPVGVVKDVAPVLGNLQNYDSILNASAGVISDFMKTCKGAAYLDRSSLNKVTVSAVNAEGQATDGAVEWNCRVASPSYRRTSNIVIPLTLVNGSIDIGREFIISTGQKFPMTAEGLTAHLGTLAEDDMFRHKAAKARVGSVIRADRDVDNLLNGIVAQKKTAGQAHDWVSDDGLIGIDNNASDYSITYIPTGETVGMGDGVDMFMKDTDEGTETLSPDTDEFNAEMAKFVNGSDLVEAYFPEEWKKQASKKTAGGESWSDVQMQQEAIESSETKEEAVQKLKDMGYESTFTPDMNSDKVETIEECVDRVWDLYKDPAWKEDLQASKKTATSKGALSRAKKAFGIIEGSPKDIGSRKWDNLFEMYDGGEVDDLLFDMLAQAKMSFNNVNYIVQSYYGEKLYRERYAKAEARATSQKAPEASTISEDIPKSVQTPIGADADRANDVSASRKRAAADTVDYYWTINADASEDDANELGINLDEIGWDAVTDAALKIEDNCLAWLEKNIGHVPSTMGHDDFGLGGTVYVDRNNKEARELVLSALEDEGGEPMRTSSGTLPFYPYTGVDDNLASVFNVEVWFQHINNQPPENTPDYSDEEKFESFYRKAGFTDKVKDVAKGVGNYVFAENRGFDSNEAFIKSLMTTSSKKAAADGQTIAPDFWIVGINETEYWADDIKDKVDAIVTYYLYDANEITHLASFQGSYYLRPITTEPWIKEGVSEEEREKIFDDVQSNAGNEADYFDEHQIDSIPAEHKKHIGDEGLSRPKDGDDPASTAEYEEGIEAIMDHYRGNPPYFPALEKKTAGIKDTLKGIGETAVQYATGLVDPDTETMMSGATPEARQQATDSLKKKYPKVMQDRLAAKIQRLSTGEPDQDYDTATYDKVVEQLAAAGFSGATHREFDKYQGVYLAVPGVGKFWSTDMHSTGEVADRSSDGSTFTYKPGTTTDYFTLSLESNPEVEGEIAVHGEDVDASGLIEAITAGGFKPRGKGGKGRKGAKTAGLQDAIMSSETQAQAVEKLKAEGYEPTFQAPGTDKVETVEETVARLWDNYKDTFDPSKPDNKASAIMTRVIEEYAAKFEGEDPSKGTPDFYIGKNGEPQDKPEGAERAVWIMDTVRNNQGFDYLQDEIEGTVADEISEDDDESSEIMGELEAYGFDFGDYDQELEAALPEGFGLEYGDGDTWVAFYKDLDADEGVEASKKTAGLILGIVAFDGFDEPSQVEDLVKAYGKPMNFEADEEGGSIIQGAVEVESTEQALALAKALDATGKDISIDNIGEEHWGTFAEKHEKGTNVEFVQEALGKQASKTAARGPAIIYSVDKMATKDHVEHGADTKSTDFGVIDSGVVWSADELFKKLEALTSIKREDWSVFEDGRLSSNINEDVEGAPVTTPEEAQRLSDADGLWLVDYNVRIELGDGSDATEDRLVELLGIKKYGSVA